MSMLPGGGRIKKAPTHGFERQQESFMHAGSMIEPVPQDYKQMVVSKIRARYSIDDELAILRQRDTKPEEFAAYDAYAELCKMEAKMDLQGA